MQHLTSEQIHDRLTHFGRHRWQRVVAAADEEPSDLIGPYLLVAIGLRESGLRNIVGDGGHGRGWLQIDDRSHASWLRVQPGCRSGTWTVRKGHHASEPGWAPGLLTATMYAITILSGNVKYASAHGVPRRDLRRVAVAGYNCGIGNSVAGYRRGNVDRYTAGGDYSRWVLNTVPDVKHEIRALGW